MAHRLLVVDDESDVREFASNFFRRRKLEVTTAASGEEALDLVEKQRPDLVLLDIKMEGIDGVETLRRIKQLDEGIKVIMVTGRKPGDDDTYDTCLSLGAQDYIHKPLQLDELERIVMKTLMPASG
jgi:two-component system response regulator (stage 0 sporulation protein F)